MGDNHVELLLQGLERFVQAAQGSGEVDPFYEVDRSFNSLHPPTFDSTKDFMTVEKWLASVKDKFQILRAPNEYKVELAGQLLEGHARFWWQEVKRRWDEITGPPTWEEFETEFERRYMDIMSREALHQKFVNLKQGSVTVVEYNFKFENLMRYAPDILRDDFRLRQQYLSGLNARLAQIINIPGIDTLADLMLRATTAESYESRISQASGSRNVKPRI
ncbi:uncharacterized protein LOC144553768 [Carex rostrata]